MNRTGIEWTTFSANPVKYRDRETGQVVWACVKHSAGCARCYAESLALRYGRGGPYTREAMAKVEPFIDDKELHKILTAKTVGGVQVSGSRVFIGDMTDIFGEWVPDEMLDRLFAAFALRPDVTFQVLTKRADRMAAYMSGIYRRGSIADAAVKSFERYIWWNTVGHQHKFNEIAGPEWPLPNVWVGVSCENQATRHRIDTLRTIPAAVRFLSLEPLLEDLGTIDLTGIHWVIVGGESGPNSRPFQLDWARAIQNQCDVANVPLFFKQAGSNPHDWTSGDPDNYEPSQIVQLRLRNCKGGDLSELPHCLNVREFPEISQ